MGEILQPGAQGSGAALDSPTLGVLPACDALFEVRGTPVVRVDIWSHKLQMWVYLVPQKTGNNPYGTLEVTPEEIDALQQWITAGYSEAEAFQNVLRVQIPGGAA